MKRPITTSWRLIPRLIRTTWHASPTSTLAAGGEFLGVLLGFSVPALVGAGIYAASRETDVTWAYAAFVLAGIGVGLQIGVILLGIQARVQIVDSVGHAYDLDLLESIADRGFSDRLLSSGVRGGLRLVRDQRGAYGSAIGQLSRTLASSVGPAIALAAALAIDLRLGILILLAIPVLYITGLAAQKEAKSEEAAAVAGERADAAMATLENHNACVELRVMGAEQPFLDQLEQSVLLWRAPLDTAKWKAQALVAASQAMFFALGVLVLIWIGTGSGNTANRLGAVVVGLLLIGEVEDAISTISTSARSLAKAMSGVRTFDVLTQTIGQAECTNPRHAEEAAAPGDAVSLAHVHYRYPDADDDALKGIDLRISQGEIVAIVGGNGAGKTTLVDLMAGLLSPTEGTRTLSIPRDPNGEARVATARQRSFRLAVTPREYFAAIDADSALGHNEAVRVESAISGARATFLDNLPAGLDTPLGDAPGETGLSGGQWHRLAIARALARPESPLMILDEPTANIDPASEQALTNRLIDAARTRGVAMVIVSHRFGLALAADRIVVLEGGRIVEQGSHEELLQKGGDYARGFQRIQEQHHLEGA